MKGWSKKSEAVWNGISIVLRVVRDTVQCG